MCFGAVPSFASSVLLIGIGVATLKQVRSRQEVLFGAFPVIFGAHQLTEGLLWVTLERGDSPQAQAWLILCFLWVALFLWPVYAPLSIYLIERDNRRKKVMLQFVILGAALGSFLLLNLLSGGRSASVINCSIYYDFHLPVSNVVIGPWYLLSVFGAALASSSRMIFLIGVINILFCGLAAAIYYETFTSVWCFFASLVSAMIYLHFRNSAGHDIHTNKIEIA